MAANRSGRWRIDKQINLSVLIQIVFLASLIIVSWANLQRQLDLLQKDVNTLVSCQKDLKCKIELLSEKSISYEYRLRAIEKQITKDDFTDQMY